MAVINRIRQNVGLVIILIGLALFAFILTDLLRNTSVLFGGNQNEIGNVAGVSVEYASFNAELQNAIYQEQQKSGNNTVTDDVRQSLVNRAWENLVTEIIMDREYASAGITVSPSELMDMFIGPDPSPIIMQQFAQGGQPYDPNQMKQILARSKNEPEVKTYLSDLEKYMVSMRLQEKYMNVIRSGMMVSKAEAKTAYYEDNRTVSFNFVGVNYSSIPDSAVEITDDDIRKFIASNKALFTIKEPEANLTYVPFYKRPSASDSANALQYLQKIRAEFATATNDSLFVSAKSSYPYDSTYRAFAELDDTYRQYLTGVGPDSVVGPFFDGGVFRMMKISDSKTPEKPKVKVSHLMVQVRGFTLQDTLRAKAKADSLLRITNAKNFEEQVELNSDDNATVTSGGNIGWYTEGRFGEEFDEKIFNLPVNQMAVLKSRQGYHIVMVTDKANTVFRIAEIVREITPSTNTLRELYRLADQFAGIANDGGDLAAAASQKGYDYLKLPPIKPSAMIIPGMLGTGELVKWALTEERGKISSVIETSESFVVAYIESKKEEGQMSVEDVRANLDRKVINEKKASIIKAKLASISTADFTKVRDAYGRGAFISQADNVSFASATAPGIGNDPIVVGNAFRLEANQTSKPIAGSTGVYIIKITAKNEPPAPTEQDLNAYQQNLMQSKANGMASKVYLGIRDHAAVKDFRYKFGL
jgi:peptidyl-prolyl cis-trans isomerase D